MAAHHPSQTAARGGLPPPRTRRSATVNTSWLNCCHHC